MHDGTDGTRGILRRRRDPRSARHENHPHEHASGSRNATAKRSARGRSDGQNDIEMRRGFGLGIAMGNACEEAKGAADYVTSDIDDDGVSRALSALGICPADFSQDPQPKRALNSSDVLGCV